MKVLTAAIARSIEHNGEIVDVDLSDLLTAAETSEYHTAANEWDLQAFRDFRRDLVENIIMDAFGVEADTEIAKKGVVWEMRGNNEGEEYRVHIRLDH